MSNHKSIPALADEKARVWFPLGMSTVVLAVALAALFMTFSMQLSPCSGTVQAAQCDVGDDEVFTGPVTFEGEINVGSTPVPGSFGSVPISRGADTPPEWSAQIGKSSTETVNNSDTLQDDDDFQFAVEADASYLVEGNLLLNSASAADFKWQWSLPASATIDGLAMLRQGGTSSVVEYTEAGAAVYNTDAVNEAMYITGTLVTSGTAGTSILQWAQNATDVSDTVLLPGSWIRVWRVE